jgi:Trypsin-like peptidase domain
MYCKDLNGNTVATFEGNMSVRELLCWRTAFLIKLVTVVETADGAKRESIVEIFGHLAERESHLCVGSDHMGAGMRRLILSGRGQVGDGGRKVWKGGFLLVCKSIRRVLDTYGGLEFMYQGFCPECLANRPINEASYWGLSALRTAVKNSEPKIRCQHGHEIDTRLVAGPVDTPQKMDTVMHATTTESSVPVQALLRSVVLVGLWDGKSQKVVRVGSGFVVDKKHGLIVTAAHTLMNIWGDRNSPFGENYYGLRQGKVVIGVIPTDAGPDGMASDNVAMFRYFATIVAKDPAIETGECHIDACVLRITTRLENDVGGNGQGCGSQPERLLLNNPSAMKHERLYSLKVSTRCELEEQVRIVGFNQGGEGLLGPGESLSRYADFAKGYVCKKFASGEDSSVGVKLRDRFKPRSEIVVICPTIGGHSGGPCVNQQGEVIGILSRADPAENQRCYLSPTNEWKHLVKMAKNAM